MAVESKKPRILLLDCESELASAFEEAGYSVTQSSFGDRWSVARGGHFRAIPSLPDDLALLEEQEIIFVDAAPSDADYPYDEEEDPPPAGVDAYWQSCEEGRIDAAPLAMSLHQEMFDRILKHGGLFIVFLGAPQAVEYRHARIGQLRGRVGLTGGNTIHANHLSFLSRLRDVTLQDRRGQAVTFDPDEPVSRLLGSARESAEYCCTIASLYSANWKTFAHNKFGEAVGARTNDGHIVLLPRLPDFKRVAVAFLEGHCAAIAPKLLSDTNPIAWIHSSPYEISEVVDLLMQKELLDREYRSNVERLDAQISEAREKGRLEHALLTATDRELVEAVLFALGELARGPIVDVDKDEPSESLREDIRIEIPDRPMIVVDVKGLKGLPSDEDLMQAKKHAQMRSKELKRTDVHALAIINAQRFSSPHSRIQNVFRAEMVRIADDFDLGFLTTFDLFALLRGKRRYGWPQRTTEDVFFRSGRVSSLPSHYHAVGKVTKSWRDGFGLIPTLPLAVGATLGIYDGSAFRETKIRSMQVEGQERQSVSSGEKVGIRGASPEVEFREGERVYLVATEQSA